MDNEGYAPFVLADEARRYLRSSASDEDALEAIATNYAGGVTAFAADVYQAHGYRTLAASLRDF
jgi:hypothetical protein